MKIDKQEFLSVVENAKNGQYPYELKKFVFTYAELHRDDVNEYLNEVKIHVEGLPNEIAVEDLFQIEDQGWGISSALIAFFLKSMLEKYPVSDRSIINGDWNEEKTVVIDGDLIVNGNLTTCYLDEDAVNLIILGSLTIKGDYNFEDGGLIVLGDLDINGAFDEKSDYSLTVVCGNVNAHNYLNSSGDFFAGGKVSSPMLYFSYNQGECMLKDGFRCLFLFESDHLKSFSVGENDAKFIKTHKMQGVEPKCGFDDFKSLQEIFKLGIGETFVELDFATFDKEKYDDVFDWLENNDVDFGDFVYSILEKLRKRDTVFREGVLDRFFA